MVSSGGLVLSSALIAVGETCPCFVQDVAFVLFCNGRWK